MKAFESIIGYDEIKLELTRILDQLKHPEILNLLRSIKICRTRKNP